MAISDNNQLEFSAIQAEIDTCMVVIKDYEVKVTEGLQHLNEVGNRIAALRCEQVRILSTVQPIPGAPQ